MTCIFRITDLIIIAATALSIVGGIDATSTSSESKGITYQPRNLALRVNFMVTIFSEMIDAVR